MKDMSRGFPFNYARQKKFQTISQIIYSLLILMSCIVRSEVHKGTGPYFTHCSNGVILRNEPQPQKNNIKISELHKFGYVSLRTNQAAT